MRRRLDGLPAACKPARVIGSIRHKALRDYWTRGQAKGPNAGWIRKLRRILAALEAADGRFFGPWRFTRRARGRMADAAGERGASWTGISPGVSPAALFNLSRAGTGLRN